MADGPATSVKATAKAGTPSVSVRGLALNYGQLKVLQRLDLDVAHGEFLVLLGPSGCGKSTLLNCIAGLLEPSEGQVFIGGRNVTWDEPKDRGIGMVFQSYALYPQMTVEKNMSFGLRVARMPKDEIERRVKRATEILQIEPLLKRKPVQLSGGQRQRVAIGRALVRQADVFLFDEPLSNLDAKLRAELRVELKRLHQTLANTMIYVTHDQIEAMTLADRIAIMKSGVIQQLAPPQEVYSKPANKFVAEFIGSPGMRFVAGTIQRSGDAIAFASSGLTVPLERYPFLAKADGAVELGIRPEHVEQGASAASMPFRTEAEVEIVETMGAQTLVWTRVGGHSLTLLVDSSITLKPGDRTPVGFDPARCSLFDAKSGQRL